MNMAALPHSPVNAHAYGYNDSIGELRNQQDVFGNSIGSSERQGNKKQLFGGNFQHEIN
jgi:hypothetical protein